MIKPLGQRILVKVIEETSEVSGLIIANKKEPSVKASVLVGKDEVPSGSTVYLKSDCGVPCRDGLIIGLIDVLAVIEPC